MIERESDSLREKYSLLCKSAREDLKSKVLGLDLDDIFADQDYYKERLQMEVQEIEDKSLLWSNLEMFFESNHVHVPQISKNKQS